MWVKLAINDQMKKPKKQPLLFGTVQWSDENKKVILFLFDSFTKAACVAMEKSVSPK